MSTQSVTVTKGIVVIIKLILSRGGIGGGIDFGGLFTGTTVVFML
jgi:hypothetical protein